MPCGVQRNWALTYHVQNPQTDLMRTIDYCKAQHAGHKGVSVGTPHFRQSLPVLTENTGFHGNFQYFPALRTLVAVAGEAVCRGSSEFSDRADVAGRTKTLIETPPAFPANPRSAGTGRLKSGRRNTRIESVCIGLPVRITAGDL